ncbi:unnamed protein product [Heligmosomoides polygyrus]|uniref:Conserved domain protein n=1 Tax=Heligmosomoides polygyrus TaxID=6339 RepID=A0A183GGE9_HELPZ|nr:unnamed protein product [Heligmosomoides polygyrus]
MSAQLMTLDTLVPTPIKTTSGRQHTGAGGGIVVRLGLEQVDVNRPDKRRRRPTVLMRGRFRRINIADAAGCGCWSCGRR